MRRFRLVASLNEALQDDFKHGEFQKEGASEFEERFGVIIGDVTVSKLMPSKEVQKAIDGNSESAALEEIVARSLGKKDMAGVHAAVADKDDPLTSEQVSCGDEARHGHDGQSSWHDFERSELQPQSPVILTSGTSDSAPLHRLQLRTFQKPNERKEVNG